MSNTTKKPLSKRTVIEIHNRIYCILKWAKKWNLVSRNVAEDVEPPSPPKDTYTILTPEQAITFLESNRNSRLYPLYVVTLSTGLRKGEVSALTWNDIDFINQRINIDKQVQQVLHKGLKIVELKTDSSVRNLPIPKPAYDVLIEHRAKCMGEGLVFATGNNTPFSPRNVTRYFKEDLKKAGLPHMRFHELRHSCASYHIAKGTNIKFLQEYLGHSKPTVTLNTYAHLLKKIDAQVVSKLDNIFERQTT